MSLPHLIIIEDSIQDVDIIVGFTATAVSTIPSILYCKSRQ